MYPLTVHSGPCIYYLPVQEQKRPTARDLLQTPRAGVGMTDWGRDGPQTLENISEGYYAEV